MRRPPLLPCLLLAACSPHSGGGNDDALLNAGDVETAPSPGARPVPIGESGPAFAACGTDGVVVNISPAGEAYLPVRAAPFVEGKELARLGAGARVAVCTRSIDQHWLGVVVSPASGASVDCGVAEPVASVRPYAGPCASGWIASAFVRFVAD